jgi:hypothetical protein
MESTARSTFADNALREDSPSSLSKQLSRGGGQRLRSYGPSQILCRRCSEGDTPCQSQLQSAEGLTSITLQQSGLPRCHHRMERDARATAELQQTDREARQGGEGRDDEEAAAGARHGGEDAHKRSLRREHRAESPPSVAAQRQRK